MATMLLSYFFLCLLVAGVVVEAKQPHIVVLVADDMGWNDVSWHNSKVFSSPMLNLYFVSEIVCEIFSGVSQALCEAFATLTQLVYFGEFWEIRTNNVHLRMILYSLHWVTTVQISQSWVTDEPEQVLTPHLAALVEAGVKLDQHYRWHLHFIFIFIFIFTFINIREAIL